MEDRCDDFIIQRVMKVSHSEFIALLRSKIFTREKDFFCCFNKSFLKGIISSVFGFIFL